ncbi:lycopene cyclase domain-containing protein [Chryseosolibacter indicus]|uniref:Lycopene cyclase domain-containing protein n=1 Tax=Chryseosolibacter indicus TaxID=2782351 RepID=A0ABS5VW83_9BACT|nr:lycopene cyclase domain-containing protein [Chryseosolibacter indicus]MBT1705685.1 lycopene cyclase domain-containing protein [Chryseosolibacter indicus]
MNEKYYYLAINIGSFIIPFIASFYPKANFSRKWKFIIPAILITAFIFIVWDELFTRMGVWGFNERYLTGIFIFNLPLEEILFFICIPYSSIFIYFSLNHLIERDYFFSYHQVISNVLIIILLLIGVYYLKHLYTSVTFILTSLFLAFLNLKVKPEYMGRFYFAYLFVLIPFFIVNGILTGSFIDEPIVWYNNEENLNIRLGTIPVEDAFYGLLLILNSIVIAEMLETKYGRKNEEVN